MNGLGEEGEGSLCVLAGRRKLTAWSQAKGCSKALRAKAATLSWTVQVLKTTHCALAHRSDH